MALVPQLGLAAAYMIEARTEAQAYQFRGYSGADPLNPTLLPRRRLVQYLGLDAFEIITGQPIGFESSLRVYADLGLPRGQAAKVDGLRSEDADLLYANVHYRGKQLHVRVGRQVYIDLMDYMAFDGVTARYLHASGFGAEAYAGLWVKGASLLGSSVYQPDGTRESDARRQALDQVSTGAELDDIEPVYGAKLFAENMGGISGSVGYRRGIVLGKTDLERVAAEARYGKGRGLTVVSGVEYDLFMSRLAQARLLARLDREEYALSAEVMRVRPVLSADSIFLYFASAPRDSARARLDYTPVGPFRWYLQVVGDFYSEPIHPDLGVFGALQDPALPQGKSLGGAVGTQFRAGVLRAAADVTYKGGFGGRQIWGDLTGGFAPSHGEYSLDARLSVANITDGLNPLLRGTFFGAQLWGSYMLTSSARISMVLEQNVNAFTRTDTKMFFLFDLKAAL